MGMTQEEKIAVADMARSHDRFGPVSLEAEDQALAAFPDCLILSAGEDSLREDTEAFGMRLAKAGVRVTIQRIPEAMHGFTTNRTNGWSRALERQYQFFQEHLR